MNKLMFRLALFIVIGLGLAGRASAQVKVTVLDVGTGECLVLALPGKHYVVYDTGDFAADDTHGSSEACLGHRAMMAGLKRLIPKGTVDLLILSHDDSDHIGGAQFVLNNFEVKQLYWARDERGGPLYTAVKNAIEAEADEGCKVVSMAESERPQDGEKIYEAGGATLTFLTGRDIPPDDWISGLGDSEKKNAGSIVVRLTYAGKSILICGDAIGRKRDEKNKPNDPPTLSRATEAHLLELSQAGTIELRSDVVVAGHHGGDNASSLPFIKEVKPLWVIFSSGHDSRNQYKHPRAAVAERYHLGGVRWDHMLRTDLGDNDTAEEWQWGDTSERDLPGDDDIEISITRSGTLKCAYASFADRAIMRRLSKTEPP